MRCRPLPRSDTLGQSQRASGRLARFLEAQQLTYLQVAIAPLLIGDGPQGLALTASSNWLSDAIRPEVRALSLGADFVFGCGLNAEAALVCEPEHGGVGERH